ncbi:MAG: substrate-binding domain-containing protein [Streptosporangiaceae bacterium]|jgi:ribose transport system substrate-binding protein
MAIAAAAGLALAGCTGCSSSSSAPAAARTSSSAAASATYHLTGTAGLASDAFWISLQCGGTQAAAKLGATIKWYASTSGTDSGIIAQTVQAAQLSNPDGVILSPVGSYNNSPALAALAAKHIPVIEPNATQGSPYYQAVESPEQDPSVVSMADLIAKNTGGTGTVAILAGIAAVPAINYRWQPLVAELKKAAPKLKVLPVQYDSFDSPTAAKLLSAEIVAHPDMKAVWDTSGPEGIGAASAVKAAGDAGKIGVYSYDAEPEEVSLLKQGVIKALIAQSPYNEGKIAVEHMIALLKSRAGNSGTPIGKGTPFDFITPTQVLTLQNVNQSSSAPYEYSSSCS